MIIVSQVIKRPEDNQGVIEILYKNKIISENLVNRLSGIASFRNILVHDYEKIDREIVYEKLKNNLNDFKDFKKAIVRFLKKKF